MIGAAASRVQQLNRTSNMRNSLKLCKLKMVRWKYTNLHILFICLLVLRDRSNEPSFICWFSLTACNGYVHKMRHNKKYVCICIPSIPIYKIGAYKKLSIRIIIIIKNAKANKSETFILKHTIRTY